MTIKLLIGIFLSGGLMFAQSAGNSGLSFLKFGFGARNIAMADAGTAASNDLTALYYNSAKLTMNDKSEIIIMHSEWIQDVRSEMLGVKSFLFGIPFALGFNVTNVSDIEIRTKPGEAESKFNANYFFSSISTAFNLSNEISAGISGKYLYEGLLSDEATGFGVDLGINYLTPIENLSASAVVKNLGSMNALKNEKTKLPSEFRIGGAYNFYLAENKFDVVSVLELQKYLETDDIHFNIGCEVFYDKLIALRAGYQTGYESRGFTAGLGLRWGNLGFDYAFLPFSFGLGNASLFSLQFKF
jgi:hypothetical protein